MTRPLPFRTVHGEVVPVRRGELVRWQPAELEPAPRPAEPIQRRRRIRWPSLRAWAMTLATLVSLAAAGGLVWLIVLAVQEVIALVIAAIAWVRSYWWVILGVVLALVLLAAGGSGPRCPGLHCGGCRR